MPHDQIETESSSTSDDVAVESHKIESVRPNFENGRNQTRSKVWVYYVLLGGILLFGCYAQWLNGIVYQNRIPFFDSMAYYDRLFDVMSIRQQEGLGAAIKNATVTNSTICWPYLMALPLSYFSGPSRAIGVWIEIFYLAVFIFSFAYFLDQYRRLSGKAILVSMVPIFLMSALYRYSAGISDLRVDLPMAFMYGSVACWLLVGCWRERISDFVIVGILMGIACLSRGIAPVYLMTGFLPLVILRFMQVPEKKKFLLNIILAIAVTVLIAGWFYYLQHKYLYYYYFQWNTDANANVTFSRSMRHVLAAAKSIGPFVAVYFLSLYVVSRSILSPTTHAGTSHNKPFKKSTEQPTCVIDPGTKPPAAFYWLLWIGVAPLLLLIAKRSAVNPVVSLPASIGLMLFWINSQQSRIQLLATQRAMRVGYTSCICLILVMSYGYVQHRKSPVPNAVSAQQQIIHLMRDDAKADSKTSLAFANAVLTDICDASIHSSLQYEMHGKYVSRTQTQCEGATYQTSNLFMLPAQVEWERIPGKTIEGKISFLFQRAKSEIDYLISPTIESIPQIQAFYPASLTSDYSPEIIQQALAANFLKPISEPIVVRAGIELVVYKVIR